MKEHTATKHLQIKRAYEPVLPDDGYRILVDRLWPRGIKKESLQADVWAKYIAPSSEVRKQFGHIAKRYDAFKEDYTQELDQNPKKDEFINSVQEHLKQQNVTLVYGAKNEAMNQAVVLKDYVLENMKDNPGK